MEQSFVKDIIESGIEDPDNFELLLKKSIPINILSFHKKLENFQTTQEKINYCQKQLTFAKANCSHSRERIAYFTYKINSLKGNP